MKTNRNIKSFAGVVMAILFAVVAAGVIIAQPPIVSDGRSIRGTWNLEVQWRTCDNNTPQLLPTPALISFAGGGVVTELDSSIWCDTGHCTNLGVWQHVSGGRYTATYKRFRLNPNNGTYVGYVIVASSVLHRPDDTLRITDNLRFYDPDGVLGSTRCRTSTGTRFTGEN